MEDEKVKKFERSSVSHYENNHREGVEPPPPLLQS